jgi:serine/threonine-protein kinase
MDLPFFPQPPRQFRPPQGGEVIDNDGHLYFIGPVLGAGGFGTVYECTDEWANDLVAKVLLPHNRSYEIVRDQWLQELDNLVLLRHPNITYIHDAFEYQDTFYLIMERCSWPLFDLIQMPEVRCELWLPYVARDILQALEFIHQNGYVHKDLHPGNIFASQVRDRMDPLKEPIWLFKIGDLGISRLESDIHIFNTILARWMAPPEYLDPVQFGPLDRHVDIYHAGLLLLSLLLNRIPEFTLNEILAGLPRQLAEGLSSPYASAIARALRRHVAGRPQTALEFWREISLATVGA